MSDGNSKTRRKWVAAIAGIVLLAGFVMAARYLTSPRFHAYVRSRVIANLEEVTGGRVELGSMTWKVSRLEFELRDLTIHGKEAPGEAPYIHVDRLLGRAKILSLFGREIGLRALEVDRPLVHLIVYPDGTTNQPSPAKRSSRTPVERLFDLSLRHLEVRNGELRVNGDAIPLNVTADEVAVGMSYDRANQRYDGAMRVGRVDAKYRDLLPVASAMDAAFSLWPTVAEVKSLRWTADKSLIEARGRISDFRNPKLEATYNAHLDLQQLGRVARWPQVRSGTAEFKGQATGAANDLVSAGTLVVRNLEYRDAEVRVGNANLGAQYSANRERLLISHLFANVFGGTVVGNADVRHWMTATQQGTARLQIQNMPVPLLTDAVFSRRAPLKELHLAGTAGGTVNARWTGSPREAQAAIVAQITPPAKPRPGELPLLGRVEAEYFGRGDSLRVATLDLTTRATRLLASGTMGSGAENVKLTLTTSNLGELQPLVIAALGPQRLPVELRGQASFRGSVYGRVSSPAVVGHVRATDFDTVLATTSAAAGQQGSTMRRAHWDSVEADVLYGPKMAAARNGVLRGGRAQLNFDVSAGLERGTFSDTSPLSAHVVVRNAEIRDLQALAGYDYPVAGTLNASMALTGSRRDPRGSGRIDAAKLTVYGEPITGASADVLFAGGEAQFSSVNILHNGARATGAGAYNPTATSFRFDLTGTNVNLARMHNLQRSRLSVGGTMNFTARGAGTKDAAAIDGNIRLAGLTLNGERAGDFTLDARTTGSEVRLTGRSTTPDRSLDIDGSVQLRNPYPASITVKFAHLDFDPLLRAYLQGRVTGHSSMAGNIELRGSLRHPNSMEITGAIDQLSAEVAAVRIWNDGPIRFRMGEQVLRLEQLRLLGEDTSISASGTAQLGGAHRLDMRSEGHVNLKLLQSYRPQFASSGSIKFGVQIGGVVGNPQIEGQVQIANAALSYTDLPNGLSEANGVLIFNRDRLAVQSFTARTGGGTLNVGGFITYGRTLIFNLDVNARDVRLRYPPGISSMASAELKVTGSLQDSTVSGDVTVTKFGVNPQFDFAQYLARAKQPLEVGKTNLPVNNVHLDVHVVSTPELEVQTSLAKLSGDLDLRLRGTAAKPIVLGKVNIIEGSVSFNGAKYHVERGDITFTNPVRIEPVLDVEATARVKEYDVTLGFHGPLDRLATTYRSDPPLPSADIIALLALGHTREETATQQQPQQSFTEAASYAILGQALNAAVSSRVQRIFGVSRIKIDPQATSETGVATSGPQLSIEQQVNNNITLTYVTNLSQGNQQTIQLQYDVNRNVSIIAIRDDLTGVVSFDVKIRQRRK